MQRGSIPAAHRPRNGGPPPPGTFRTKSCRHYEQGRCSWGSSCRFLHGSTANTNNNTATVPVVPAAPPAAPASSGSPPGFAGGALPAAADAARKAVRASFVRGAPDIAPLDRPTTPITVRVGSRNATPNMADSTTTQPGGGAEGVMPPTNPSTPAVTTMHATPSGTARYAHNPYQSSPLAPGSAKTSVTTPPQGGGAPPPIPSFEAMSLPALPKPMQQAGLGVNSNSWQAVTA